MHPFPLVAGNAPQPAPNEANHTLDEPHETAGQTAEAIVGRGMDDVKMEEASPASDDEAPDNVEPSASEPLVSC